MRLRPAKVHAAIREGLSIVGRQAAQTQTEREEVLKQEERLLADLSALAHNVEDSANYRIPGEAWCDLRHRILHLRTQMRELRRRYPGIDPENFG